GREHERRGPGKAVFRMGLAKVADCVRGDVLGLPGAAIVAEKLAVGSAAINDVGIGRIRRDVPALARARGMPVAEGDGAVVAAAEDVNAAGILLRAVDVVGKLIVDGNVVELRGGLVIPAAPGASAVHADACALVAAKDHSLWVGGINPERVIVVAAGRTLDGDEGFPGVGGAVQRDIRNVDRIRVLGIDIEFAEVPHASANAGISSRAQPGLPAIFRFEKSALLGVDQSIDALALRAASNRQAGTPPVALGEASAGYGIPDIAAIGRFVDGAGNRDGWIHAPRRTAIMQQCGPNGLRVVGIKGYVDSAGVFVAEKDFLPGCAAIAGAEDAA